MKTYRPVPPVDPNTFGELDINDKFYYGFQNNTGKGIVIRSGVESYEVISSNGLSNKNIERCYCWEMNLAALFEKATRVLENKIYQFKKKEDFYLWLSNDRSPALGSVKYFVSEKRNQEDNSKYFGYDDISEDKFYGVLYSNQKYIFKKNENGSYYLWKLCMLFDGKPNKSSGYSLKDIFNLNVTSNSEVFQFNSGDELEQWYCAV